MMAIIQPQDLTFDVDFFTEPDRVVGLAHSVVETVRAACPTPDAGPAQIQDEAVPILETVCDALRESMTVIFGEVVGLKVVHRGQVGFIRIDPEQTLTVTAGQNQPVGWTGLVLTRGNHVTRLARVIGKTKYPDPFVEISKASAVDLDISCRDKPPEVRELVLETTDQRSGHDRRVAARIYDEDDTVDIGFVCRLESDDLFPPRVREPLIVRVESGELASFPRLFGVAPADDPDTLQLQAKALMRDFLGRVAEAKKPRDLN